VTLTFGRFELDEPRRVLRLDGREMRLQPKVFELLVYLVHKRSEIVTKEELLDTLWPNVTVTEGSLQRAVSVLRSTLRQGGLEDALRSLPRIGYRLCLDEETQADAATANDRRDPLASARDAVSVRDWATAATGYAAADTGHELDCEDLEAWALALQCLGRPADAIPVLMRAIAVRAEMHDNNAAAADSVALAVIHLERGEVAIAKGWLARAETLVAGDKNMPSLGRIFWMRARIAALECEPQQALALAERAFDHGKRLGHRDIEAIGLMYRGFFRLSLGDTRAGLADQDNAGTLALSGNCDPMTGSTLYCNILWACRTFGDWARANQWTVGYQQFCTQSHMEFSGSCQLHRAEVLSVQGSLEAALDHIEDALTRLKDDAPWAQGDAYRVLGDIHAAAGDNEAALTAYQKAYDLGWDPEPGHAMLLLEMGETEAAYAALERSLVGQDWWKLQRQAILLAHLALVAAHANRLERAEELVAELSDTPARWPMPSIRALTNEASAVLAKKRDQPTSALHHLHLARQLWTSIDSPVHAARLRLAIAEMQIELGDVKGAQAEIGAATVAAETLASAKLRQVCTALAGKISGKIGGAITD
jgi:DNA-binding winged helix-turn-helix (wHTH) protein